MLAHASANMGTKSTTICNIFTATATVLVNKSQNNTGPAALLRRQLVSQQRFYRKKIKYSKLAEDVFAGKYEPKTKIIVTKFGEKKPDPRNLQDPKPNPNCKICYRGEHDENDCPVFKSKCKAVEQIKKDLCYVCQKPGHQWPACPEEQYLWESSTKIHTATRQMADEDMNNQTGLSMDLLEGEQETEIELKVDSKYLLDLLGNNGDSVASVGFTSSDSKIHDFDIDDENEYDREFLLALERSHHPAKEQKFYEIPLPHIPPRIARPRDGMTVEKFLTAIGRNAAEHIDKFESWHDLFSSQRFKMKEKGLNIQDRKYIMKWLHRYRYGLEPYAFRPLRKDRQDVKIVKKKDTVKPKGNKEMSFKAGLPWNKRERANRKKHVLISMLQEKYPEDKDLCRSLVNNYKYNYDPQHAYKFKNDGLYKFITSTHMKSETELIKENLQKVKDYGKKHDAII